VRQDGALIATVAGTVERVNKLVCVRPLRSRYSGEVGDVVVCRIIEVGQKRWKVDVNGRQDGVVMLSSINLPGGEQRRRTAEDQLNMRQFYVEHDLLSAEVQAFFQDGSMSLHTRSLKYGKLQDGVLVVVNPSLVKRLTQHFHRFKFGVDVIFAMNGYLWVSAGPEGETEQLADGQGMLNDVGIGDTESSDRSAPRPPTREQREKICRVRNALVALDTTALAVSPSTVATVYTASLQFAVKDMLLPHVISTIIAPAMAPWPELTTQAAAAARIQHHDCE